MDAKVQKLLDCLPPKGPSSRLEPHLELIREMRKRGRSYREIAQFLIDNFNVQVAHNTIHDFVRVRSKTGPRPQKPELAVPPEPAIKTTARPKFSFDPGKPLTLQPSKKD